MANWKIQDIAPPKSRRKERKEEKAAPEKTAKRRGAGRGMLFWAKVVVVPFLAVLLGGVGILHVFFAKAAVTVWPETREIRVLEPIVAEVGGAALDKEERVIPASTLSIEKKATRLFPASSKSVKVDRASGTIRVFNAADTSPKILVAQTRFVSEGGKLFRTPERITVPGGKQEGGKLVPGYVDVKVAAAEAGEDYNIGPSHFSLPGLSGTTLFTSVYAESFEPMTGGSEREVSVVSEEDIARAKNSLIEELTQKAKEELLAQVPEGMTASEGSVAVEVTEAQSLVQAGSEVDEFNVSASLKAVAFIFSREDVNALVDSLLASELGEGERIALEKTETAFQRVLMQEDGTAASLELEVTAKAYRHMDATELKLKLRGKSKEQALAQLASLEAFEKSELSFWPFWISTVPGSVDKLEVKVLID